MLMWGVGRLIYPASDTKLRDAVKPRFHFSLFVKVGDEFYFV